MGEEKPHQVTTALAEFGLETTDEFWKRYHTDAWVFHLTNIVVSLKEEIVRLQEFERYHDRRMMAPSVFQDKWGIRDD